MGRDDEEGVSGDGKYEVYLRRFSIGSIVDTVHRSNKSTETRNRRCRRSATSPPTRKRAKQSADDGGGGRKSGKGEVERDGKMERNKQKVRPSGI